MNDDFSAWDTTDQWLDWIPQDPYLSVRKVLEMVLDGRRPGCRLKRIKVTAAPKFLTGMRGAADSDEAVISRAGLLLPFEGTIENSDNTAEEVVGAFTWVATQLHGEGERADFGFVDLGDEAESAEEQFPARMYTEQ